jgi:hypothetical protein
METETNLLTPKQLRAMADAKDKSKKEADAQVSNTREVIETFFKQKSIAWGFGHYYLHGKSKTFADIHAMFIEWAQEYEIPQKFLNKEAVNAAYHNIEQLEMKKLRAKVSNKLEFEDNDEWEKLKKVSGFSDDDIKIYKSWIWNVKRGAAELPQEQVPMPMLYSSAQGVYKSTFNQKLYSPVQELTERHDIKIIADNFSNHLWSTMLVADFDEMSGFGSKDITLFKSWYYCEYVNGRSMYSQKTNRYKKITQGIGSSNKPIEDIIWDTTGSRRVWQVDVKHSLKQTCESIDFLNLWKSVDINAECPLVQGNTYQTIMKKQFEKQRRKSVTEIFLDYFINNGLTKARITASDLYRAYSEWCLINNEKTKSNTMFGRELGSLGYIVKKSRSGNSNVYEFINFSNLPQNQDGLDEFMLPIPNSKNKVSQTNQEPLKGIIFD